MTQVSKLPLRKEIEDRIFETFLISLGKVRFKEEVKNFLEDLLSPIEQLMLAKRISIAYLLKKGYDQRSISKLLKVSLSTINRISLKIRLGGKGYQMIYREISRMEKNDSFWQRLDDLIGDVVPSKGVDWSAARKERYYRRLKNQKPF